MGQDGMGSNSPSSENHDKEGHLFRSESHSQTGCLMEEKSGSNLEEQSVSSSRGNLENIDGGYAWVVVFASFFNAFIIDGIGSSFGLMFQSMTDKFNASDFVMSFAGSLFMAFLIMGTVSDQLTKKFGFRAVTIAGGVLSCLCFICSAFVPNVYVFILFYGLLTGCSCGLVFLPSIIIVNAYFQQKRGIANGIISAGSGAGLVVLGPLISYLLEGYSLQGTILILSAILLHMSVFSSLYRPPPGPGKHMPNGDDDQLMQESQSSCLSDDSEKAEVKQANVDPRQVDADCRQMIRLLEVPSENFSNHSPATNGSVLAKNLLKDYVQTRLKPEVSAPSRTKSRRRDEPQSSTLWKSEYQLPSENLNNTSTTGGHSKSLHSSAYCLPTWYNVSNPPHQHHINLEMLNKPSPGPHELFANNGSRLYLAGSIHTLRSLQKQHEHHYRHQTDRSKPNESLSEICVSSSQDTTGQGASELLLAAHSSGHSVHEFTLGSSEQKSLVHENLDSRDKSLSQPVPSGYTIAQLLRMPSFHFFYCGASLVQIGYPVASTFLAKFANELGHTDTALLMSLLGCLNICGRLLGGILASLKWDPLHLNNTSLLLVGVSCVLCPVYKEFWSLCLYAALYGFFLGFFSPLQPLIIVKHFGLGSLSSAFGFLTTIKGVASFFGSPLAGWIYDETGWYALSFVFGGVVFILSALVHWLMVFDGRHLRSA
ncbi:unnamed protein product [Lymnaea stagnalis]|uniref:Major facilitator superfamily (MFS) profile domain-containing protein n=1 Tax=Lymnaea stagnalis TaxID=6523 RepID=A0AAV2IN96_LYMST